MYKIIGADGNEYGPVTTDQVQQWIVEGRANAQTKVLPDGATAWVELGALPEFAATLSAKRGPTGPPLPPAGVAYAQAPDVTGKVQGPAIAILIVSSLSILWGLATIALTLLNGATPQAMPPDMPEEFKKMFTAMESGNTAVTVTLSLLSIICCAVAIFGALKMRKLESYGLAMTSAILMVVPCLAVCCCAGLPIGIWALVVLMKPEVKASFR